MLESVGTSTRCGFGRGRRLSVRRGCDVKGAALKSTERRCLVVRGEGEGEEDGESEGEFAQRRGCEGRRRR